MTDHDADVAAVLAEAVRAHLSERIAYHGPYGATSEEQWQMDTEKQFAHELNDGELQAELLAALAAAGIRCLYVPEGVEVEHGARLVPRTVNLANMEVDLYAIEDTP